MQKENTNIRTAQTNDLQRLNEIFNVAREKMRNAGNPSQWPENYPSLEVLQRDMELQQSYLVERNNKIVATFVLAKGINPTYLHIEQGNWLNNDLPYATIHRVASDYGVQNIGRTVIEWCKKQSNNLRADTHRDNLVMQHLLLTSGFKYCGIIHVANGTERLAYQWLKA